MSKTDSVRIRNNKTEGFWYLIVAAPNALLQVKPRVTPAGKSRRKTISAGDIRAPQQQPPPQEPLRQPNLRDDEDQQGGGSSAGGAGVFNVGVAGPARASDGKRRKSGV